MQTFQKVPDPRRRQRLETIFKTIQILNLGRKTLPFKARKIIIKIHSDFIENLAKDSISLIKFGLVDKKDQTKLNCFSWDT